MLAMFLAVAGGGFAGGTARYGFTRILPPPYCTLVANVCGALAIGLTYGFVAAAGAAGPSAGGVQGASPSPVLVAAATAGFAGGLSTWSTLAKELGEMLKSARYRELAWYLFLTLALGIIAAARGAMWAGWIYNS